MLEYEEAHRLRAHDVRGARVAGLQNAGPDGLARIHELLRQCVVGLEHAVAAVAIPVQVADRGYAFRGRRGLATADHAGQGVERLAEIELEGAESHDHAALADLVAGALRIALAGSAQHPAALRPVAELARPAVGVDRARGPSGIRDAAGRLGAQHEVLGGLRPAVGVFDREQRPRSPLLGVEDLDEAVREVAVQGAVHGALLPLRRREPDHGARDSQVRSRNPTRDPAGTRGGRDRIDLENGLAVVPVLVPLEERIEVVAALRDERGDPLLGHPHGRRRPSEVHGRPHAVALKEDVGVVRVPVVVAVGGAGQHRRAVRALRAQPAQVAARYGHPVGRSQHHERRRRRRRPRVEDEEDQVVEVLVAQEVALDDRQSRIRPEDVGIYHPIGVLGRESQCRMEPLEDYFWRVPLLVGNRWSSVLSMAFLSSGYSDCLPP